jgi:8-oxo-dGTP diphosphatase
VTQLVAKVWTWLPISLRRRLMWLTKTRFTIGVSGVVLNASDEILLVRHRFRETSNWELPGGLVARGEQLETALRRELKEETGYSICVLSLASAAICTPLHLDACFVARIVAGHMMIDTDEVVEARFFPYEELSAVLDQEQMRGIDRALDRARQS